MGAIVVSAVVESEAVAQKLDEARALIERGWTQGDWAKDATGECRLESEPDAVCWCAGGAMFRVADGVGVSRLYTLFEAVIGGTAVTAWNDAPERTQAEVIEAFKRAASLARGDQ